MPTPKPFRQTAFLEQLESFGTGAQVHWPAQLAALLTKSNEPESAKKVAAHLADLLKAAQAVQLAALGTTQVADELRRYQKFARPGQPSAGIVQLRQQQAAARQLANQSKQRFIRAAAVFVREADIKVPPRVALDAFITQWLEINVAVDSSPDISQQTSPQ